MKKNLLAVCIAVLLIVFLCMGTKIQSVDDYYLTHIDDITADSDTVFLSIECGTILENWDDLDPALRYEKYVPSDGIILDKTEYVLRPKDTVYDILDRAARYNKIQIEFQGGIYVEGLNYLYERSCGPLSGWMYKVNGEFPNYGCSVYELEDGDVVEWVYTCDQGRDVGSDWGIRQ